MAFVAFGNRKKTASNRSLIYHANPPENKNNNFYLFEFVIFFFLLSLIVYSLLVYRAKAIEAFFSLWFSEHRLGERVKMWKCLAPPTSIRFARKIHLWQSEKKINDFWWNRTNHWWCNGNESGKKTSIDKLIFFRHFFFFIIIYHCFIHLLIADRYRRQLIWLWFVAFFLLFFFRASIK